MSETQNKPELQPGSKNFEMFVETPKKFTLTLFCEINAKLRNYTSVNIYRGLPLDLHLIFMVDYPRICSACVTLTCAFESLRSGLFQTLNLNTPCQY